MPKIAKLQKVVKIAQNYFLESVLNGKMANNYGPKMPK